MHLAALHRAAAVDEEDVLLRGHQRELEARDEGQCVRVRRRAARGDVRLDDATLAVEPTAREHEHYVLLEERVGRERDVRLLRVELVPARLGAPENRGDGVRGRRDGRDRRADLDGERELERAGL